MIDVGWLLAILIVTGLMLRTLYGQPATPPSTSGGGGCEHPGCGTFCEYQDPW